MPVSFAYFSAKILSLSLFPSIFIYLEDRWSDYFFPYETMQPKDTVEVKVQLPSFYGICTCLKTILEELTSLQYTMHDKQCTSPYISYQKFGQAISVLIEDRLLQFVYFQSFLINHEYRTHYAIVTFDVTICCALTGIRYTQANKKT